MAEEIATLAGGCFWCVEAVFKDLIGVSTVESGYIGGRTINPTYREVCGGDTGHAEAIRVTFDPALIGYGDLLAVYKWNARNTVSLLVRNNLSWSDNKGGYQLDWSFPLYGRLKGYVQVFTGYGESLIDYNWRQTTFGIGVLLTDWM